VEFRLLGALEVLREGRAVSLGGPKQRAVLAHLLLRVNHVVPADALIDAVWGEDLPETARKTLQGYVSHLRKALGEGRIEGRSAGYVLHAEAAEVDALRFEALVRRARQVLADDPERASELLSEALALWRGPPLADLAAEPAMQGEAARLDEARLAAIEDRIAADLDLGRHAHLVGEIESYTRQHPLREQLWEHLMLALYRSGRQAEALRAYQQFRTLLGEELGLDPSSRLRRLQEGILLNDPSLGLQQDEGARVPSAAIRNPYKGIRPFDEGDAADFFGRQALLHRIIDLLNEGARFLALVGPSGCGKSSAVNAGLIPAIRAGAIPGSEGWNVSRMVPGTHPFDDLRAALHTIGLDHTESLTSLPSDVRVLLVIDQFEELFSASDALDRVGFLDQLAIAASQPDDRVRVVATLRGDFYDRPLLHPAFAELFVPGVVNVLPLTAEEVEEAVVAPARRVRVDVDLALLAELVSDAMDRAGALPLLQHALTELFDHRTGSSLTLQDYRAIGGLQGALSRRAEDLYGRLDQQQQGVCFQVFLRLVRLSQTVGDAPRRVVIGELTALDVDPVALSGVLDEFGRHRLLSFDRDPTTGDATVGVAHEALLTEWGRLAGWIDRHRSDLTRRESFSHAAEEWESAARNPDYLLTGSRLAEAEEWSRDTTLQLTRREHAFLEAGFERRRQEQSEAADRREQRHHLERRARAARWVAVVVTVALVIGATTVGVFNWLGNRPPDVALVTEGGGDASVRDAVLSGFDSAVMELDLRSEKVTAALGTNFGAQMHRLANEGVDLVISESCDPTSTSVPAEHPNTQFVIMDCLGSDVPNVSYMRFAVSEGSFLAGAAAALTSETGKIGFIGGLDVPDIWPFQAGYEAGARWVDPKVEVRSVYLAEFPDFEKGFINPALAQRTAERLYAKGTDVIYHAAGLSGSGLFEAAVRSSQKQGRRLWAIGVDSDQYQSVMSLRLPPAQTERWRRHILTSMVKRYDRAFQFLFDEHARGAFTSGTRRFGLADGWVGLSYSGGFIDGIRSQLERLRRQIISGEIVVPNVPVSREDECAAVPEFCVVDVL
jgi:basic membrane lipoprotein Med (substrate-binding protein (PBP1-ABC) superfamily)/DNA-binding SARP family transcriptional activator